MLGLLAKVSLKLAGWPAWNPTGTKKENIVFVPGFNNQKQIGTSF